MRAYSEYPKSNRFVWVLLLSLSTCGALRETAWAETVVRVGGAGTGLGAMKILARSFEQSHPGVQVQILPSLGSSGGIKALLKGALELAISSRELKVEELKQGAVASAYARTPFVFIVNRRVPASNITSQELERIYQGSLKKWPDGKQIRLLLRPENDADTTIIRAISPAMDRAYKAALARPGLNFAVTDQECADAVARLPGAVGGSSLTEIETERLPVKILSFNGIHASIAALAKGSYPLGKTLRLVTASKSSATTLQFAHFVRSAQGRALLSKAGNLPVREEKER